MAHPDLDLDLLADAIAAKVIAQLGGDAGRDSRSCMSEAEVAEMTGLAAITVQQMRYRGEAPPHIRVGRRVLYRRCDVDTWLEARRKGGK